MRPDGLPESLAGLRRTVVMGVLNVTPDSFSDGGRYLDADAAIAHGLAMHPLQQALQEYPEQAQPYADIHALVGAPRPTHTVQMWARLGHAPAVGPAPRRGLQAHLQGV